jgi:hypothetical protein
MSDRLGATLAAMARALAEVGPDMGSLRVTVGVSL